ncbi:UDP-galactopyranose mutase [Sorangium cellulosum]|uniref:UDP-galactopyranose mutase n=1 Tax=Sorangium cellulosum TaxID=56 RepID=A0A2L0EXT5_SORCE|nr:FAD-dependent oxidoreductase [Sorangium cellulosum]AUX44112.1 UDP-galactopyranose mutase [Sorangium cellulosum]
MSLRPADAPPERVVVGAGISGLYAALLLARSGRRVRLLERAARPGGLAGAELFRGLPCDLGSHRLHPAALEQPLFREMHERSPLLSRPRRGVLVLGGRHVPYPPSAPAMLRALGLRAGAAMALGFAAQRGRRAAFARWDHDRARAGEDAGFERFVRDRVGAAAYASFYRPYAEKVWGIPPAELSQTVAKKRISTTSPLALFQRPGRARGGEAADLARFIYPPGGIASIITFLEARLAEAGVTVACGTGVGAADLAGLAGRGAAPVLFAGDLRDLVPDAPLEHRGLYLVYLAYPRSRLGAPETYYCPDPRFWFGRVSELQNYAPDLRRPGETVLCVEIPEGAWGRGRDFASGRPLEELLDQLVRAGIAPRGVAPVEARQRFVPGVYPLYRRGWLHEWRRAMRRAAALGVLPFGRQALFLHCNLDHCAAIAADAVAHVEAGRSPEAWVLEAERYLDVRVRD